MVHTQESAPMNWVSQIPDRIPVRILDIVLDQDKAICHPAWEWVRHRCNQNRNYQKSNQVHYQEQDQELFLAKVNSDDNGTVFMTVHVPNLDRIWELCFDFLRSDSEPQQEIETNRRSTVFTRPEPLRQSVRRSQNGFSRDPNPNGILEFNYGESQSVQLHIVNTVWTIQYGPYRKFQTKRSQNIIIW